MHISSTCIKLTLWCFFQVITSWNLTFSLELCTGFDTFVLFQGAMVLESLWVRNWRFWVWFVGWLFAFLFNSSIFKTHHRVDAFVFFSLLSWSNTIFMPFFSFCFFILLSLASQFINFSGHTCFFSQRIVLLDMYAHPSPARSNIASLMLKG